MYFNDSFVNLSFMLMKHSRAEEWEGAEISSARGCYTVGQKSDSMDSDGWCSSAWQSHPVEPSTLGRIAST